MKRRGNGEGYVYKRGDTWTCEITMGYDLQGHRKRKTKGGFKTKKEALAFVPQLAGYERPQLNTIVRLYKAFEITKGKSLSESKLCAYRTAYKRLEPIWHRDITSLGLVELQELVDPYESHYVCQDIKALLGHLYDMAKINGVMVNDLHEYIVIPKANVKESQRFTNEEVAKFWQGYANGNKFAPYILLMIYTGLMPGEVLGITWNMINLEEKTIKGAGKKTQVRRDAVVHIANCLIDVINSIPKKGLLIYTECQSNFYKEYYECLEECGVEKKPPYTCRHTTASALAEMNVSPFVIQRAMRHGSITTTQKYVHLSGNEVEKSLNALPTNVLQQA